MKNFKIFLRNDPHSIDAAGSQDHVDMSHEAWKRKPGDWRAKDWPGVWPKIERGTRKKDSASEQIAPTPLLTPTRASTQRLQIWTPDIAADRTYTFWAKINP